jgi:hypothetical protein
LGVAGVAVQRWLGDKAWLKAGIGQGFAYASGDRESEFKSHGFGILGGRGFTSSCRRTHFTLDLQGRYSTSSKDGLRINNFGVNLGFKLVESATRLAVAGLLSLLVGCGSSPDASVTVFYERQTDADQDWRRRGGE